MAKKAQEIATPYVRGWYERERTYVHLEGESMTHQSHAESCDVNNIIRRYERTGELPRGARDGIYADVTGLQGDLTERIAASREALQKVDEVVKRKREEEQLTIEQELARLRQENAALKEGRGETGEQPGES